MKKLQRVQNCAARLISKEPITGAQLEEKLIKFHWLKVKHRVIYKLNAHCTQLLTPESSRRNHVTLSIWRIHQDNESSRDEMSEQIWGESILSHRTEAVESPPKEHSGGT